VKLLLVIYLVCLAASYLPNLGDWIESLKEDK